MCKQRENSASLAQASVSRLNESCRTSFLLLYCVSHLGDPVSGLRDLSLARARDNRLSEDAK